MRFFTSSAVRSSLLDDLVLASDADRRRSPAAPRRLPSAYRPLLALAVFTGMRIQEILGLTWGDIDFRERVIRVRAQLSRDTTGSRRARSILRRRPAGEISHSRASLNRICVTTSALPTSRATCHVPAPMCSPPRLGRPSTGTTSRSAISTERRGREPNGRRCSQAQVSRSPSHVRESPEPRGLDPVRASRQLGRPPSITLDIYAHQFEHTVGSTTCGFDRRRLRAEPNLTKSDMGAEVGGLGTIRALSRVPQTACSSRLRGWSVPGSNRRPPACKFSYGVVSGDRWWSRPRKQAVWCTRRRRRWSLSVGVI